MKFIIDLFYFIPWKKKQFIKRHPNEVLLLADGVKAIKTEQNESISLGKQWAMSRRAILYLTEKRLICGSWEVLIANITEANLVWIPSGQVLKVKTKANEHYQFGMQKNKLWLDQELIIINQAEQDIQVSTKRKIFTTIRIVLIISAIIYIQMN